MFKGSDCCWKGKREGVRFSGSSGRGWKHDTNDNCDYSDDELQMHHFYKQLRFHHKKQLCTTSVSPLKADSEKGLASVEQGGSDYKITQN